MTAKRSPYVWDYDISEDELKDMLAGKLVLAHMDKKWATVRLIEYAPYKEIIQLIGFKGIVEQWEEVRQHIRSQSRKRGLDFLVQWLKEKHPEKI